MFKELGYKKVTDPFGVFNIERYVADEKAIDFYGDSRTMAVGTLELNVKEMQAIYLRCKELRWL